MDVTTESTVETAQANEVSAENTQAVETPATESAQPETIESFIESKQASKATNTPVAEVTAAPAYTPNYKYKVKDQEREFPDYIRAAIKDEATEKSIRDLMTRVDGLDEVKASRDNLQKQWQAAEPEYRTLKGHYSELAHHWQAAGVNTVTGKIQNVPALEAAFNKLGVNDKVLFEYVNAKLDQLQQPQAVQAHYQTATSLQAQAYQLQQERDMMRSQYEQFQQQQTESQLAAALSTPDAQAAVNFYGDASKLRDEIIMRGRVYESQGVIKTPQELVAEVTRPFQAMQSQTQQQTQPQQSQQTAAPAKPAVIPVLKGGGVNVVKPKVQSIADIEKRAAEL